MTTVTTVTTATAGEISDIVLEDQNLLPELWAGAKDGASKELVFNSIKIFMSS